MIEYRNENLYHNKERKAYFRKIVYKLITFKILARQAVYGKLFKSTIAALFLFIIIAPLLENLKFNNIFSN